MDEPLISVILPCYNQCHFLNDSVGSVINQDYKNWELLLINDGSTDETLDIAHRLALKESRIKIIDKANGGLSSARNSGLEKASGELFHFLDSDDRQLSYALSTVVKYFNENSKIDIFVSSYSYFIQQEYFHTHIFNQKILGLESFFKNNIAPPVSFFIKKSCQERIGLYDETLKSCEDWDFWIRAAKAGARIKTIPDVLVGYRYVPTSMSRNAGQMYEALKEVSFRAVRKDPRIAADLPFNKDYNIDVVENLKFHFLRCLGVYLMQGKVNESVIWFLEEGKKWKWEVLPEDFEEMNSYLSFRYFLEKQEIEELLKNTLPNFERFFLEIGLTEKDQIIAIRRVFAPQIKRRNHYRYGKLMGALVNRLTF